MTITRLTRTQDMLAFLRAAELGSLSAAARVLGVTTSSISKGIQRVEAELGVQLMHRSTRSVTLTEQGMRYLDGCRRVLQDLEDIEATIKNENSVPKGVVRISLPPAFARRIFVPKLPGFFERYPALEINLQLRSQTANPMTGGYDLTVHSGSLADSALVNRVLIRGRQKTVASPRYLEKNGAPSTPYELREHHCIIGRFGPRWRFLDHEGNFSTVNVNGRFFTDSGDLLIEAAVSGLGISQGTWWLFKEDLRLGNIISILESYETEAEPIFIVLPQRHRIPAKVQAVIEYLLEISR